MYLIFDRAAVPQVQDVDVCGQLAYAVDSAFALL
jgi:hypothetical protein